jgi:hypothetical protein
MLFTYTMAGLLASLIFPPSRSDNYRRSVARMEKNLKSDTVAGTAVVFHHIPFSFAIPNGMANTIGVKITLFKIAYQIVFELKLTHVVGYR